ncbi:alpha/beta hydrolase [Eupransor demetentiae]|uniref:Acetyl esterase/lipase (Aes) n=1 Tax=Eupransor demetentiae TaxID=3109584 RepID=A0ABM9N561_9LACO|nr:Acetyl esterase/lipase (Aes) [Lactobacillaceae bacterium LMG 33000]
MLFKDRSYNFEAVTINGGLDHVVSDISYASGERHKLDLYIPKGEGEHPVIVDLYGGGLVRGEKSSYKLTPSLRFINDGYAVASMDYSHNSDQHFTFPNQIAEVRAAVNFLTANAAEYNLKADQVSLIGESSGAQLAVLAAASFSAGVRLGHLPGESTKLPKIKRVIGMYGPYELDAFHRQFDAIKVVPKFPETGAHNSFEGLELGNRKPAEVPYAVAQGNPANYFTVDMPPLMLVAGTADQVVPYVQSVNLAKQYQALTGRETELHIVEGAHHGITDFDTEEFHQAKLKFLQ